VAFSIGLWHVVRFECTMTECHTSTDAGWSGMALVAKLQLAAGTLEYDGHPSSEAHLQALIETVGAVDWTVIPVPEFLVARSLLLRFICEVASRRCCPLTSAAIVMRLGTVQVEGFVAAVADAINFLLDGQRMATDGTGVDKRVQTALTFIKNNCQRSVRIDDVAATVGLSRWHFERLTKRDTGTSPRGHLVAARMERAGALLRERHLSIKELAFRVGYGNANAFTRDFRRSYGTPPRTWRRNH
jgi:AraC-like DNA-binding protein